MLDLIASRTPELEDICRRHGVRRLDVFGSAARETDFTPQSDVDLIAVFDEGKEPRHFREFFSLQDDLTRAFGRKVDLISDGPIRNLFVRRAIERDRKTIYGT